ncbi:amidase [Thermorudis peleae]|uniref:amidase n=1 Tax=Thermorudis peleae TaxID=1382356 RepID=UPI000690E475|nr:amidase [Thermorudis peleae]
MSQADWAFRPIRELAQRIRAGELTPTALAEHCLERLDAVGRSLNAVVTLTPERALREARQAEEELRAGIDRGPLHGIPYGAKDLLAAAGYPTTWGAAPLRDQRFAEDAAAVARLRDAGAVLVAKLATVELAGGMGYQQPNASLTGPGINPWNRSAWSGGSSSGPGSAVAAGAVPFALGTETWGSILTPASYCGISGLRPSYGRVSRYGAMPLSWTLDKIGPMARSADDCGLVLAAISGPDPRDPATLAFPSSYDDRPEAEPAHGFRIGVLDDALAHCQPEVAANFHAALAVLAEIATVEPVRLPTFPYTEVATLILWAEAASALEPLLQSGAVGELTAPEDRTGGYAGLVIPAVDYLRAQRIRRQIVAALDRVLSQYDAIVAPATAVVASPLDQRFRDYAGERRLVISAASNLAGVPAISVPTGFGERGLPTGMQIIGRYGADGRVLAVARAYQQRTDWHLRRPPEG